MSRLHTGGCWDRVIARYHYTALAAIPFVSSRVFHLDKGRIAYRSNVSCFRRLNSPVFDDGGKSTCRENLRNVSIFLKTENDLFFRYRIVSSTISHLAVNIVERSISKRRRRNAASPKANRIRNIVDKSRVNQNQTRRNSHLASIERTIQSI